MEYSIKFHKAINALKPDVEYTYHNEAPMTEELFNKIEWQTGENAEGIAITTTTNPHPELTWEKVSAEIDAVQSKYDSQDYARKRQAEYPSTKDFMEAYTEKEIGGSSGKWDAYVINYNKVRTENPK
jgi:hypothetical protein